MDLSLIGIFISLILTGWFAGAETVFLSINRARLHTWKQAGTRSAANIWFLTEKPERFVGTTLVGNNLLTVLYSSLAAIYLEAHQFRGWVIFVFPPLVLLVFSEALPKAIARQVADRVALAVGWGLIWSRRVLFAATLSIEWLFKIVRRRYGLTDESVSTILSRADIAAALDDAGTGGIIPTSSRILIKRFFRLSQLRVQDIMTARTAVASLPDTASVADAAKMMADSGYSKLPIFHRNMDDMVGWVNAKDILPGPRNLAEVMRPLPMIPGAMRVINLMPYLRKNRADFAGVVDEFGGLAGIVGHQDLAAELVGPLLDEYDAGDEECVPVAGGIYLVRGSIRLSHLAHLTGIELPPVSSRTLSGALMELAGGVPAASAEYALGPARFRALKAGPKAVELVRMTIVKEK